MPDPDSRSATFRVPNNRESADPSFSSSLMLGSLHGSVSSMSAYRVATNGAEVSKFNMMMMGDTSAGKSDMMARYFAKDIHSIFSELTKNGIVVLEKELTISGR